MRKIIPLAIVVTLAVGLLGCGGARVVTEKRMLEWCPILNMHMATNFDGANSYPDSLNEINPTILAELSTTDGWGKELLYRKLRIDKYNLISAGPDGEFGNGDDIMIQNGSLYEPGEVYSEYPLKR